jgi:hypothetical protein
LILPTLRDKEDMSFAAAKSGSLAALQWLQANGCPWDRFGGMDWDTGQITPGNSTTVAAAGAGHLELLQWARANGCPWAGRRAVFIEQSECHAAARGGHLAVLQWLRANGCSWGENTCYVAAHEGHLEVLQWAVAYGCPWDRASCLRKLREDSSPSGAVWDWIQGQA